MCISFNSYAQQNLKKLDNVELNKLTSSDKYKYFNESLNIHFTLNRQKSTTKFSEIILKIISDDNKERIFIADWNSNTANSLQIYVLFNDVVNKLLFPISSFEKNLKVQANINYKFNTLNLKVGDSEMKLENLSLSINQGYKISTLNSITPNSKDFVPKSIYLTDLNIYITETSNSTSVWWIWFIVIVLIDIVIFTWIYLKRKRKKLNKNNIEDEDFIIQKQNTSSKIMKLPSTSAIYILEKFVVYDKNGNEITKSFSPLLKELLVLLIVYSAKSGISTKKIIEILWYDKKESSAKNNRAVYFSKLRSLLNQVGDFEINNKTNYWLLKSNSIFIDYTEYKHLIAKNMQKEEILKLIALTNRGNLLPNVDYRWIVPFQADMSDTAIQSLLKYADILSLEKEPELNIQLANIVFKFDSLSEKALTIKCKAYIAMGRHSAARKTYKVFCKDYEEVYGEHFNTSFANLINNINVST